MTMPVSTNCPDHDPNPLMHHELGQQQDGKGHEISGMHLEVPQERNGDGMSDGVAWYADQQEQRHPGGPWDRRSCAAPEAPAPGRTGTGDARAERADRRRRARSPADPGRTLEPPSSSTSPLAPGRRRPAEHALDREADRQQPLITPRGPSSEMPTGRPRRRSEPRGNRQPGNPGVAAGIRVADEQQERSGWLLACGPCVAATAGVVGSDQRVDAVALERVRVDLEERRARVAHRRRVRRRARRRRRSAREACAARPGRRTSPSRPCSRSRRRPARR